jgi:alpha-methylacyl-CoA racemase
VYTAADAGHIAVGALEPQFYRALLEVLEIPEAEAPQWEQERCPSSSSARRRLLHAHARRRGQRCFADVDACTDAPSTRWRRRQAAHMAARGNIRGGSTACCNPRRAALQPHARRDTRARRPILGRTPSRALTSWGIDATEIAALRSAGAVA